MSRRGAGAPRGAQTRVAKAIVKRLQRMGGRRVRVVQTRNTGRLNPEINRRWTGTGRPRANAAGARHTTREWQPNTIYRVQNRDTGSDYVYRTDRYGRVDHAEGRLVPDGGRRNDRQQRWAGGDSRGSHDAGGHIFAREFGGSREGINYLPMNSRLNSSGRWQQMEKTWREALDAGCTVDVRVNPRYLGSGERPDTIVVTYTITEPDGTRTTVKDIFRNI